jgi:transcriptional antiterminator NusG
MRTLFGEDRDYAVWIYKNQGCIAPSKVLCQGDQVTIVDGPLKECHGIIKRLDKHKRRAWVSFRFAGEERTVSLGVELLG